MCEIKFLRKKQKVIEKTQKVFLPKDVYEAGKDHPAPSLPKQLLCHLLLAMAAVYMIWAYKDVAGGIKRGRLSFFLRSHLFSASFFASSTDSLLISS